MTDITLVLLELQKVLQKTTLVLHDALTVRDPIAQKRNIIGSGPLPNGEEQKFIYFKNSDENDISANEDEE
jgi:hypothetical protein